MPDHQDHRSAVLFADVSGSTRLYERLGDKLALEAIGLCLGIMRDSTLQHGGRVVKTIGDELMCVFPDATAAAQAAADMQTRVALQDPVSGQRLAIRVGMQFGPVIEKAEDVFGDCVNVAARMVALAKPGQIITTRELVEKLPADLRLMTRNLDSFAVRGKLEETAIYELMSEKGEDVTTLVKRPARENALLRLFHNKRVMVLESVTSLAFGRDPASDFVIADKKASRQHARIERRRDKFVLADISSNGTFVTFRGQGEFALRHEEVILRVHGSISFGHGYADDPTEIVAFEIE